MKQIIGWILLFIIVCVIWYGAYHLDRRLNWKFAYETKTEELVYHILRQEGLVKEK